MSAEPERSAMFAACLAQGVPVHIADADDAAALRAAQTERALAAADAKRQRRAMPRYPNERRSPGRRAMREQLRALEMLMPARFDARKPDAPPGTPPDFRAVGKGYTAEQVRIFFTTSRQTLADSAEPLAPVVGVASREAREERRAMRAAECVALGVKVHPAVKSQRDTERANRLRRLLGRQVARRDGAVLPAGATVEIINCGAT